MTHQNWMKFDTVGSSSGKVASKEWFIKYSTFYYCTCDYLKNRHHCQKDIATLSFLYGNIKMMITSIVLFAQKSAIILHK